MALHTARRVLRLEDRHYPLIEQFQRRWLCSHHQLGDGQAEENCRDRLTDSGREFCVDRHVQFLPMAMDFRKQYNP